MYKYRYEPAGLLSSIENQPVDICTFTPSHSNSNNTDDYPCSTVSRIRLTVCVSSGSIPHAGIKETAASVRSSRSTVQELADPALATYIYVDGNYLEKIESPWKRPRVSTQRSSSSASYHS